MTQTERPKTLKQKQNTCGGKMYKRTIRKCDYLGWACSLIKVNQFTLAE